MFRPASNCLIRASSLRSLPRTSGPSRRFLSTAPPAQKSRSWKSSAVRWGLAGAVVYYYNTSNVFAEEPDYMHQIPDAQQESEASLTLDAIARRKQREATSQSPDTKTADVTTTAGTLGEGGAAPGSPEELEEEAGQQGAFNPETGEINWDCPCLGGMATGPCGDEFKAAFSCFVYSKEEPKGVDCIENFKGMQDCFRQYPDIYGAELDDDDEEDGDVSSEAASLAAGDSSGSALPTTQVDASPRTEKAADSKSLQQPDRTSIKDEKPGLANS